MSAPVVTTYIRYLYPGTLEGHDRAVANRDPEQAVRNAPEDAYGFTVSERISAVVHAGPDREPVTLSSPARRVSRPFFIDGTALDAEDVASLPGNHRILLDNMRVNRWERVIRCRTGNFLPFAAGDTLVGSRAIAMADRAAER